MKLAVIACHFNWARFDAPARNLQRFLRQMDRFGVPVFGTELHVQGTEPETADLDRWQTITTRKDAILWQKERLLNHTVKKLPREFDAIACIDADLEFSNPTWIDDVSRSLEFHPAIQPFEWAHWTDERGKVFRTRASVGRSGLDMKNWRNHPGFAWAFRRSFFEAIGGFYDKAPMGAGDIAFAYAMTRNADSPKVNRERIYRDIGVASEPLIEEYRATVQKELGNQSMGYAPGEIYHEWHGHFSDRQYDKRRTLIRGYDAEKDLKRHRRGYYAWTRKADKGLVKRMQNYFSDRKEDG